MDDGEWLDGRLGHMRLVEIRDAVRLSAALDGRS
jgi:hypothetical protein